MARLRAAACQINTVVGDLDGNVERILDALAEAEAAGADLAVFPELAVTGYPPEDLLLKPGFVADNRAAVDKLAKQTRRCAAVVGFVDGGRELYNAAAVCVEGELMGVYRKRHLPNYAVYDEERYFAAGDEPPALYDIAGVKVGIAICEDVWDPEGPIEALAAAGARLLVVLNASTYYQGKLARRERTVATRAAEAGCPILYANLVGGQDEVVYDGASTLFDASGRLVARAPQFEEEVLLVDFDVDHGVTPLGGVIAAPLAVDDEIYRAVVTGTRDYVCKNGFSDVAIGLSGGVDSSLVATIAVDALGADHVHGVLMPSRFSSEHSLSDAEQLSANLGIDRRLIPIEAAHAAFEEMLATSFEGVAPDLTEENLQARIRGVLLMALANKFGWLVLSTGNKSEAAVGYSTLYGDTAGAFAPIKDVYKTRVYSLCRNRNSAPGRAPVPESVLTKAPSAELRPDQRDDDSLPPYELLDRLLENYIENDRTAEGLVDDGFDEALVGRVVRMVDRSEYKRRQTPPGVRVTSKAFGRDRRLPITNRYGA